MPGLADRIAALPRAPGVYRFRDARGRVLYLGRAGDLRSRVRSYLGPLNDRPHLRRMARRIASADHLVSSSEHEAAFLERRLLERSCPPFNRIEGTEVLAYLRYEDSTGLAFWREPRNDGGSYLGPYVGSSAARLAADALNFLFPVPQAIGANTVARELGRSRGFGAIDAARLRAELFAVLAGEPAPLARSLARLARRRDDAAVLVLFEDAERFDAQVAAVAWLAQPVDHRSVNAALAAWS